MKSLLTVLFILLAAPLYAQDSALTDAVAVNPAETAVKDVKDNSVPCSAAAIAAGECLRVGVRSEARPFSYYSRTLDVSASSARVLAKSGPLRAAGFDGYMVYLCDEVLQNLMLPGPNLPDPLGIDQIAVVDVDALMARTDGGANDRLIFLGDKIDILCDPATINLERVRNFAVSPPLFLTGVSYLTRSANTLPDSRDECLGSGTALIGVVGSTNAAEHGIRAILAADEWKNYKDRILAELKGDNPCPQLRQPEDEDQVGGFIWAGSSHEVVAREFCNGNISYYAGDLEIILENARRIPGCDPIPAAQSFTNDRYAVFAQIDYTKTWKALHIGRFFEVLNREIASSDSLLDRAYGAEFGDAMKSRKLELFFWSMRGARDP